MASIKKKFIEIELPLIEETISVLGTPEFLDKKTIKLDLTRKLRGRSLEVIFKIQNKEESLTGVPKKMQLMKSYIRRMMRKRTNYVEDSFKANTSDAQTILKPFLITRKKVSRAIRKNLRKTAKEFLIEHLREKTYFEICEEILTGELQKQILPKLKKVYPLSFCEIRTFEIAEQSQLTNLIIKEEIKPEEEIKEEAEKGPEIEIKEAKEVKEEKPSKKAKPKTKSKKE